MSKSHINYNEGIHLFYDPFSNCSQRVILFLEEKQLAWKGHPLKLIKGENFTPSYLKLNPKAEVPTLVLDGEVLIESCDILRLLECKFPSPTLTPKLQGELEEMDVLLERAKQTHKELIKEFLYANGVGRSPIKAHLDHYKKFNSELYDFHQKVAMGKLAGDLEEVKRRVASELEILEARLKESSYLIGEELTLADLAWFPNVLMLEKFGLSLANFPFIRKWKVKMQLRPSFRKLFKMGLFIPGSLIRAVLRIKNFQNRETGHASTNN